MKKYVIQQRIKTILSNWFSPDYKSNARFEIEGISVEQDFTIQKGPTGDYWIATYEIAAANWMDAYNEFYLKLLKIVSRISLIGQGFIEFYTEPYVITRPENYPDIAVIKIIKDLRYVPLAFGEEQKKALDSLLNNPNIPDEFFYYWEDATNTIGYSAKLLLMFSAIESLVKCRDKSLYPKKEDLTKKILGASLSNTIFEPAKGLRNKLVHGEYLSSGDGIDYVTEIHKKVIAYFNDDIFKSNLLPLEIVNPQRHFYDNKEAWGPAFIKRIGKGHADPISLKDILSKFEPHKNNSFYRQAYGTEYAQLKSEF